MSQATPQQQAAIDARGNILLVAGAGTGKTSTLVERCQKLVLEEGVGIDRLLMVTFTEAAAAEMRHRIRHALHERLEAEPENVRLAEQMALLDTAMISTLHAFCLRLLREHFHELAIDPQLTVLDEQQTKPLIAEVLEEIFQEAYADESEHGKQARHLIERYGRGGDADLRLRVKQLHTFLQTLANPQTWLAQAKEVYASENGYEHWRELLLVSGIEWAQDWHELIKECSAQAPLLATSAAALDDFLKAPDLQRLTSLLYLLNTASTTRRPNKTFDYKKPLKKCFAEVESLLPYLAAEGQDPIMVDWEAARGPMLAFLNLTETFTQRYQEAKRDLGGVDFADLEQLSLRLLLDEEGQPTAVAKLWQQRFDHIFVDECQDINAAQDALIRAVSREGAAANRFMVGDVKQSIYRFRLANPHIFQSYEREWKKAGANHQVLPLTENFRSREGVLAVVNSIFHFLMRPTTSGLAYDEDAALRFGAAEARAAFSRAGDESTPQTGVWAEPDLRAELHLVVDAEEEKDFGGETEAEDDGWADLMALEREARVIAQRLRELYDGKHQIWDKSAKEFRAVKWSDMAVLLRTAANRTDVYARASREAGVPLLAEQKGFFGAIEVLDIVNLLKVLDNPLQDIPLLAVLRSPLVGLSLDELVAIRTKRTKDCYWLALHQWHREHMGHDGTLATWQLVDEFFRRHAAWRALIRQTSLSCCLDRVLGETHYEALLLAMEHGEERVANVKRLLDLARRYDPYQRQGLFRFLQFIEAQEEVEHDLEPAPPRHPDAVQLMTVHKSKGLEFPVVVLANINRIENVRSVSTDLLWSEGLGLAPRIVLEDTDQRYPSLPHWLIKRRELHEMKGEEMRLLYVALTRARDTLILTGCGTKKLLQDRWGAPAESAAQITAEIKRGRSFLDWLKIWLREGTTDSDWLDDCHGSTPLIRWQLHTGGVFNATSATVDETVEVDENDSAFAPELAENLQWAYPNPAATAETAKTSVTVLRRRKDEADEEAKPLLQTQFAFQFPAPKQEAGSRLSGSEVGKAHHTFLQFVDLTQAGSLEGATEEVRRLVEMGVLKEDEAAALNVKSLADFWASKIGQSISARAQEVQREMPFTARFSTADLIQCGVAGVSPSLPAEEFVIVQGTIDLAVISPKEIWLLDFKSDRVKLEEMPVKLTMYEPQLKLYALALERIYQRPVKHRWLHWLHLGKTVEV
ncbi:MAG TPA: helicase-exonuclease AddAB subunit AddA [Verrucomicrobiae bacterium]